MVDAYDLILNNEPEKPTQPKWRTITSIMDLNFTTPDIGALNIWVIDDKPTTTSEYVVIVYDLADSEEEAESMSASQEVTVWGVSAMFKHSRKEVAKT